MRALKQLVLFIANVYRTLPPPSFPRKVIGKAKATKGIKRVVEIVRDRGVQTKLRSREGAWGWGGGV